MRKPLVFFSMPFGLKRTDGREQDFDVIWKELLRPAVPPEWEDVRIDEVNKGALVLPSQVKHYLRIADVVVFDLTFSNPNVLYELGFRDVLAPGRRVLVARTDTKLPFNIADESALLYGLTVQESRDSQFSERLREQILKVSPVVGQVLETSRISPSDGALRRQVERAETLPALIAVWEDWKSYSSVSVDSLLQLANSFSRQNRLDLAIDVLRRAYAEAPNDWEVARTLGWCLRRAGRLEESEKLLLQALALHPRDVEAIGMLGGMYKRKALALLREGAREEAVKCFMRSKESYENAVKIDHLTLYNFVNLGALSFVTRTPGDNTAFQAAYQKVVDLAGNDFAAMSTWDLLALGEALLVLGRTADSSTCMALARRRADFSAMMQSSLIDQIALLEAFDLPKDAGRAARAVVAGEPERQGKSIVIIHLSDVHFGKKAQAPMHRFRQKGGLHDDKSLAEHVIDECSAERRDGVELFVVISGDIAYSASEDEYKEAFDFVQKLKGGLKIESQRLVVVPGNHDVNWELAKQDNGIHRFDKFLVFLQKLFGGPEGLSEFYPALRTYPWTFGDAPPAEQIFSVHQAPDCGVVFAGLNSCVIEDNQRHFGAIGKKQMGFMREALKDVDPSWLRIAVMHHHVFPIETKLSLGDGTEMDGTIVHDYAIVERGLHDLGFDMVLHGHKHEPGVRVSRLVNAFAAEGGKSMIICGAGSASVEEAELPPDWGNHFAIYRIPEGKRKPGTPFVDIEWRELPYNDIHSKWVPKGRWKVDG